MYRLAARILGIVVGLLALVGFFVEGEHLLGFMNVDLTLDILRVVIAVALLIVGVVAVPVAATRAVIVVVGAMYVLMGLIAFGDPTLFGVLPTGLTAFDIAFHLVVGLAAIVIGALPARVAADAAK